LTRGDGASAGMPGGGKRVKHIARLNAIVNTFGWERTGDFVQSVVLHRDLKKIEGALIDPLIEAFSEGGKMKEKGHMGSFFMRTPTKGERGAYIHERGMDTIICLADRERCQIGAKGRESLESRRGLREEWTAIVGE